MRSDRQRYNLRAIHDMLEQGFSAVELSSLFFYTESHDLHAILRQFSPNDGPAAMVDKIIQYCQPRGLLPELLAEVKRAHPRLYEQHAQTLSGGVRGGDAMSQPPEWKVKVFHFQNLGETVEQGRVGERFSGFILNSLMRMQLDAGGISEEPPIIPMRSGLQHDFTEYAELAPFIAVVGTVEEGWGEPDTIEAAVRVSAIDSDRDDWLRSDLRPKTLLVEELSLGANRGEMREVAEAVAGRIRRAILELIAAPFEA